MADEPIAEPADDALAIVVRLRSEMLDAVNALLPAIGPAQAYILGGLHVNALRLAGGLEAALRCHRQEFLYGNAATEGEPDACPHPPDSDLHFEDVNEAGEWLCQGKPEGSVCGTCVDEDELPAAWPCEEYAAIAREIKRTGRNGE